jgi:predicted ATP-dependent protease
MYPNFDNKQDRSSKHQALLDRIERDQRLEAMKREAYANAIWATDSEESKIKDATETGDTLARVVAAMKVAASTSNKKTPPGGLSSVGDISDAMGDASPGVFQKT